MAVVVLVSLVLLFPAAAALKCHKFAACGAGCAAAALGGNTQNLSRTFAKHPVVPPSSAHSRMPSFTHSNAINFLHLTIYCHSAGVAVAVDASAAAGAGSVVCALQVAM